MIPDVRTMDKIYYKSSDDGKLHELGKAIGFGISGEPDCTVTGTIEFAFTEDSFKKTNQEFKPGDLVEIKSWDEMEKEFGLNVFGSINCTHAFTEDMRRYCGEILTIRDVSDSVSHDTVYFEEGSPGGWNYSTDMIKHAEPLRVKTPDLDVSLLYPNILPVTPYEDFTPKGLQKLEKRFYKILNEFEKKEENNMELIRIYRENAEKMIKNAIEKETETRMEMDSFVSSYNKLIANFEKDLTKLYEKQPLTGRRLEQSCGSNMYGIRISPLYRDEVETDVANMYGKYIVELNEKLAEVQAQLDIIRKANPTNSYELTMNVLRNYGIVDENNMLNKYELPVVESKVEVVKETITEPKKRGRKPKIQKEQ